MQIARVSMVIALAAFGCGGASGSVLITGEDGGVSQSDAAADATVAGPRGLDGSVVADGGTANRGEAGGPGGSTSTLACGSAACFLPGETCCVTDEGNNAFSYACVAGPGCPPPRGGGNPSTALACTGAANCAAGTVCCVVRRNDLTSSVCKAACDPREAQLCDPRSPSPGCPPTAPCSPAKIDDWGLPPSFGTCGGKGN